MIKKGLFIFLFIQMMCLTALVMPKNQNVIHITAGIGFDGNVIPKRWTPIRITADGNTGPLSIEVLRFNEDNSGQPAEYLSFGVDNRAEGSFFSDRSSSLIKLRVLDGKKVLSEQKINTGEKVFPGHLILLCNIPAADQGAIEQSLYPEEPVLTVPVDIHNLPDAAINYDSVSSIVIKDPESDLSPRQAESLREWISCGGKIVIESAKPETENIISELVSLDRLTVINNRMVFGLGLGSVTVIQDNTGLKGRSGNPAFWRDVLGLKPYNKTYRITAGLCFPADKDFTDIQNKSVFFNYSMIFFLLWGFTAIIILFLSRKHTWYILTGYIIVSAISLVLLSPYLVRGWQRGASVLTRAVILPGGTGILVNTIISAVPTSAWFFQISGVSPWEIKAGFGLNETGEIHNLSKTVWRHRPDELILALKSGDSNYIDLTGCLPVPQGMEYDGNVLSGLPDKLIQPDYPVVMFKEDTFWSENTIYSGGERWQEKPEAPLWLREQVSWLDLLNEHYPGFKWLVGRGKLKMMDLKVMDMINSDVYWVMPIMEEISK